MNKSVDLAIIGAGPAGLAAAELAASHNLSTIIIDEQLQAGGQILRQPPASFSVKNWLPEKIYQQGKRLVSSVANNTRVDRLFGTTVLGFINSDGSEQANQPPIPSPAGNSTGHTLWVSGPHDIERIHAQYVLVASGCYDMPVIFPGWNTPGVMAAGGIQAMVKSQQFVPGNKFLFVGTHPLQLIVADQVHKAGGEIAGIVFAQSAAQVFSVFKQPVTLLTQPSRLLYIANVLRRLYQARIPIHFGETVIGTNAGDTLNSVVLASVDSNARLNREKTRRIECDRLGLCFSFTTSSELARQAGAECSWSDTQGGWIVNHDDWMQSSVTNLYVAGEVTGVAGAEVAMEEGRLAAIGIIKQHTALASDDARRLAHNIRKRLRSLREFAALLADISFPGDALLSQMKTDNAILCKCQDVTVGSFKEILSAHPHIGTANAIKLRSRVGMGLCQGRYCNYHITKLVAEHAQTSCEQVKPFTAQLPVKPTLINQLID